MNKKKAKDGEPMSTIEATDALLRRIVELENKIKEKEIADKKDESVPTGTMLKCDICGQLCNGGLGLSSHKRHRHKEGNNVLNDTGNTDASGSANNEAS